MTACAYLRARKSRQIASMSPRVTSKNESGMEVDEGWLTSSAW